VLGPGQSALFYLGSSVSGHSKIIELILLFQQIIIIFTLFSCI